MNMKAIVFSVAAVFALGGSTTFSQDQKGDSIPHFNIS